MRRDVRWTITMVVVGTAVAIVVDALTGSLVWALVGLLAAGIVVDMLFGRPIRR